MRKISAHLILDGKGNTYDKGILTLDTTGTILDIEDTHGQLQESASVEFYSGMIVPGFVNAHCHLELSHLQNALNEGCGFVPFLKTVVEEKEALPERIVEAAEYADLTMHKNGIVAVGDIANGTAAFRVKSQSRMTYFTFVETLGFDPGRAERAFRWAQQCTRAAAELGLQASIVPHAPYSVSVPLFTSVAIEASRTGLPVSIHSQESFEEDEMYQLGTGGMISHLQDNLSLDTSFFIPTGESALRSMLKYLPSQNNLLLVHNLTTQQADIDFIESRRGLGSTWFVLCPGSNLFIHKQLPDIELLRRNNLQICLGTDSLASNHRLSVLEEMKIVQTSYADISLDEIVMWASFNGAKALQMERWAGSIEVGKRPGINLLTGLDLTARKLLPGTTVKKIG